MSKVYYLNQIEKLSTDSRYDARLTIYLLKAVLKMAKEDIFLKLEDYSEISDTAYIEIDALMVQIMNRQKEVAR